MAEQKTRSGLIMEKFRRAKTKRQQKDSLWQELDAYDRNDQWDLIVTGKQIGRAHV